jgi:hypothetical protein
MMGLKFVPTIYDLMRLSDSSVFDVPIIFDVADIADLGAVPLCFPCLFHELSLPFREVSSSSMSFLARSMRLPLHVPWAFLFLLLLPMGGLSFAECHG